MKLESCNFVQFIEVHRWRHAGGTAVGGKGDCGGEGDSNRRRRRRGGGREGDGLPAAAAARGSSRQREGDELVGQHGLWSFESLKLPLTQIAEQNV